MSFHGDNPAYIESILDPIRALDEVYKEHGETLQIGERSVEAKEWKRSA